MSSRRAPPFIDAETRAELYLALGHQLDAGLDPARALAGARGTADRRLDHCLDRAARSVRNGVAFAEAGARAGLWARADRLLLAHAEDSGHVSGALIALALSYRERFERGRRVRGRMMMPAFVLVLGLLTAPLPALVSGGLGAGGYVLAVIGPLAAVAIAIGIATRVARRSAARGPPGWLAAALTAMPGTRTVVHAHARARAIEVIAMRHRAGMPAASALADLDDHVLDRDLARRLRLAAAAAARGGPLAEALRDASLIDAGGEFALLCAAEAAGRLDEGLARAARTAHEELDALYDTAADWAPRIVYALVVIWIVGGIL